MTVIYMIISKDPNHNECYIGYSKSLKDAVNIHSANYYNLLDRTLYNYIENTGGFKNFNFLAIENTTSKLARSRKQFYIDKHTPSLNMNISIIEDRSKYFKEYGQKYMRDYRKSLNGIMYIEESKEHNYERNEIYNQNNQEKLKIGIKNKNIKLKNKRKFKIVFKELKKLVKPIN